MGGGGEKECFAQADDFGNTLRWEKLSWGRGGGVRRAFVRGEGTRAGLNSPSRKPAGVQGKV